MDPALWSKVFFKCRKFHIPRDLSLANFCPSLGPLPKNTVLCMTGKTPDLFCSSTIPPSSGITCASLSALSSEDTISPKLSLKPVGLTSTKGGLSWSLLSMFQQQNFPFLDIINFNKRYNRTGLSGIKMISFLI